MSEETDRRGEKKSRQTKDRVLQARIPEQLDDELRDRAEHLGLSVSTIVRNVLLNTFELVEGVVSDSSQIARVLAGRDTSSTAAQLPPPAGAGHGVDENQADTLVAWQEAILNKNGVCEDCNGILKKGQRAAIGMPIMPRPVLLCLDCLAALVIASSTEGSEAQKPRKKAPSRKAPSKKSATKKPAPQKSPSSKANAGSEQAVD
jgi:hypothetical protein